MNIIVVPRFYVERMLIASIGLKDWALISIHAEGELMTPTNQEILKKDGCVDILSLRFGDITKGTYETLPHDLQRRMHLFSEKQAKSVIKFLAANQGIKTLIIHCRAGVSRSGAVGLFACRYLGEDEGAFRESNPYIMPNPYVLSLLSHVAGVHENYEQWWLDNTDTQVIF